MDPRRRRGGPPASARSRRRDHAGTLGRERDIADPATLAAIARALSQDAGALAAKAETPEIAGRFEACTQEAIDRQVFGAPTYACGGELFWGQDRLDFLDRKLAQ